MHEAGFKFQPLWALTIWRFSAFFLMAESSEEVGTTTRSSHWLQVTSTILLSISRCLDVVRLPWSPMSATCATHPTTAVNYASQKIYSWLVSMHSCLSLNIIWDAPLRSSAGKVKSLQWFVVGIQRDLLQKRTTSLENSNEGKIWKMS